MEKKHTRKDGSKSLRVDLNPELTSILFEMMDERKFNSYAEAIRYCIIETKTKTEFHLDEVYWNKIRNILQYDYVHNNERIYNIQHFVNKAIDRYIEEIESANQSIMSFDVRQELHGEELDISMAFIECQEASSTDQVTVEELAKYLGKRNISEVTEVLESFVDRGILRKIQHQNKSYYNAKAVNDF